MLGLKSLLAMSDTSTTIVSFEENNEDVKINPTTT
jgi:hypothetical protein